MSATEPIELTGYDRQFTGFIYCIKATGLNRVKIGFSVAPEVRMRELTTGSPVDLCLIGQWPGTPISEKHTHQKYAHLRVRNEWFLYGDDLRAYVEYHSRLWERIFQPHHELALKAFEHEKATNEDVAANVLARRILMKNLMREALGTAVTEYFDQRQEPIEARPMPLSIRESLMIPSDFMLYL